MQKSIDLSQIKKVYQQYQEYEKTHDIPPKIRDKLICLAKLVFKQPIEYSKLQSLDADEVKQLENIEPEFKIKLFLSVANCLMGKQQVDFVNSRQAYIKRDSFWSSCNTTLTINRSNLKDQMPFKSLRIDTKVKTSKNKHLFCIEYQGTKYKIGFDNNNIAKQYRQKFRSLISATKKSSSNKTKQKQLTQNMTNIEKQSLAPSDIDSDEDKDYLQQFQVQNIQNQTLFKIIQHTQNGRIMVHRQNNNIFKTFMLVECSDPSFALQAYMKEEEWNPLMSQSNIISRPQQNCYIVYQCYKSTGYLTRSRDYVLFKLGLKRKNRCLLLQKSVTHPDYPQYKLCVRGFIKRKVTAFLPHPTNKKLILLISEIDIDFKGYNSAQDNKNLMLKHFQAAEKFSKFLIQKSFLTETQKLFDFQTKNHFDKVIFQSVKAFSVQKQSKPAIQQPKISLQQEFKKFIPKDEYVTLSNRYIELVRLCVNHYYCINHKYSQAFNQTKMLKHTKNEKTDTILLGDWKFSEDGEIEFINQKAIAAQKDIIKYVLKQIGSNLMKGKSIMNMSLPVDIFDNKSLLQRMMGSYGYVPIFIEKAANSNSEVEQIKLCSIFLCTINLLQMKLQKPFNPILGETFQGYIGGIPIYIEQISHHPPISAIYMQTQKYKIYGNLEAKVDMGLNTISGYNAGMIHIVFKNNNTHFECSMPGMQLSGVMSGSRRYKQVNKIAIMQRQKGLYCELSFGKDKKDVYVSKQKMKPNEVIGGVFKVSEQTMKKLFTQIKKQYKFSGINKKDIIEKLGQISGSWNGQMFIDGQIIKQLYDPMPYHICYVDYPLPSDSNYRQDLLFRRIGNYAQSQNSKQKLQNIQRNDRKLRGKKH